MNEAEWLACADPEPMLAPLGDWANENQLRLIVCACYRHWRVHKSLLPPDHLTELVHEAIEHVERSCGALPPDHVRYSLRNEIRDRSGSSRLHLEQWDLKHVGIDLLMGGATIDDTIRNLRICRDLAAKSATRQRAGTAYDAATRAELPGQAAIVREIFGNPFRAVAVSPDWRTDTAVALARQMYESRDFSPMPILADALQDAGCDNADVLDHCRGSGPHVRGCWVVDLVCDNE